MYVCTCSYKLHIHVHFDDYRVLKETMRGGGGNITKSHVKDIALFLMDVSRKVDCEFNARQSTAHAVRDANRDIGKLTITLLETKVMTENTERNSPPFADPTDIRHKISTTSWVADTLTITDIDDLQIEVRDEELVDLNYEISDVV